MGDAPAYSPPALPVDGGSLDATALLERDHAHLRRLLEALIDASAAGAFERKKVLFREFKAALELHARLEEEVFYPAVMKLRSDSVRGTVKEALEEHHAVDSIIAEIDQMEPEDEKYDVKVEGLRASVENHLREEEGAMFAQARNHLTDDRLQALGRRMMALREKLPAGPEA